jgi:hypothetical protein
MRTTSGLASTPSSSFIGVPIPETTALLAVMAEILIYEDTLRDACRREVAARGDDLPPG